MRETGKSVTVGMKPSLFNAHHSTIKASLGGIMGTVSIARTAASGLSSKHQPWDRVESQAGWLVEDLFRLSGRATDS